MINRTSLRKSHRKRRTQQNNTMNIITQDELNAAVAGLHAKSGAAPTAVGFNFCTAWPTAKQVLEFLANAPGYGWAIKVIIMLGDAYAKAHCH